jgi:hypothetical protein
MSSIAIPAHVKQIEHSQANVILVVSNARISLEAVGLSVADIRAIEERAEK